MRVGKMRLCQTKRAGAQIHLPDKRRLASGYRDRQRQSRIIAGMEHHAVKQVPACQRLAIFRYILEPSSPTAASGTVTFFSIRPLRRREGQS